jgi:hypothetical protein
MARLRLALAFLRAFLSTAPAWLDTRTGRILPMIAGADGADDDAGDDDADSADDDSDDDSDEDDDSDKVAKGDDDKTIARKHEKWAKRERAKAEKERKAREKLEAELKKLRDADKSDQEKALEKAREEGKTEALTEAQKERRADRLEAQTIKLAARGFKVGAGDDAETAKFADPDDALVYVERAIAKGDVDEDDIFDEDNKVKADGLRSALAEILEEKPHLREDGKGSGKPKGDPDRGKGTPAAKDLEDLSVEEHDKRIRGEK